MQHQYWITKKSVQRKLGGKEDECIVSSDAELDAKLELFRSISDSCVHLQRIIDVYQERLCYLAQEENALGRYLKECGKNEKNSSAGQLMAVAGKALAYTGHQRLTIRPPLLRLHHEVETFRGRAVSDTRMTVVEMEKIRTEYRAALSWMKSVSTELDPDTGYGLDRFRKAQSYVKSSKARFDRLMLACLQKVDLLAAARCNMFSHALISYQNAISTFSSKASETLALAVTKLNNVEPFEFSIVSELATPQDDKDRSTFFNADYTDKKEEQDCNKEEDEKNSTDPTEVNDLLGEDFSSVPTSDPFKPVPAVEENVSNLTLLEMNIPSKEDLLGDFMPSRLIQEGMFNFNVSDKLDATSKDDKNIPSKIRGNEKTEAQVSWLSLFKELDPLANQDAGSLTFVAKLSLRWGYLNYGCPRLQSGTFSNDRGRSVMIEPFEKRRGFQKMFSLLPWVLLILSVNIYALVKRNESRRHVPIVIAVFAVLVILPLIPVLLTTTLIFASYREIINIILKLKHGNLYNGIVRGFDVIHTVDEICNSKNSILTILEYDGEINSKCFFDVFLQHSAKLKKTVFNKIPKFKSKFCQCSGYTYMLEHVIDINECVRKMPLIESEHDELDDFELAQLLKKAYNMDFPNDNNIYWDFLIGTQPIRKKINDGKNSKWYPVLFRNHHCIADGVSLVKFLVGVLADAPSVETAPQDTTKKLALFDEIVCNTEKITLEKVFLLLQKTLQHALIFFWALILSPSSIYTLLFLRANDKNFLHKTNLKGESILVFYAENDDAYFNKVKSIKRKIPGTSFPEILLAAYSQSLCNYFKKKSVERPGYITSAVPFVPGSSQLQHLVPGTIKFENIQFRNDYTLVLLDLPIFEGERHASVMKKLKLLKKEINNLNSLPEYYLMHISMNYMLSVLPTRLIHFFLRNFDCTTSVSIVPGHMKTTYANGALSLVNAGFWTPHLKNIGLGFTAFTYDGRLSFGISIDEALVDNYDEAQSILDDVLRSIDLLEREVHETTD
ncbi:hypothetical protein FQR65_LT13607 [Abscondita terminalis]|nr:hypothetical protein FQR65_LT13607 [Abscondita terminalis]